MDEQDLRAGLRTIAERSMPPPLDAQEQIHRRARRLTRGRRAVVGATCVAVAGVVVGTGIALGLGSGPGDEPRPAVPATSPTSGQAPGTGEQSPPTPGPGEIVCVHPDGSFAGRIDVDRPSDAPPLTRADMDRSCDAEWPGSASR
jgi:hypothetical protein